MILKITAVTVIVFFLHVSLSGHSRDPKFVQISVEQGLSHIAVNSILQDADGFLWFGTTRGLNRYDGYNFLKYYSTPEDTNSLASDNIVALCANDSNYIWIVTGGGFLNRMDRSTAKIKRYHFPQIYGGRNEKFRINDIRCTPENRLWLATNAGVLIFDPVTGQIVKTTFPPPAMAYDPTPDIRCMFEDQAGRVWLGTAGMGLYKIEKGERIVSSPFLTLCRENSLASDTIHAIRQDPGGDLWLGTSAGLVRFNPNTNSTKRYRSDPDDQHTPASNTVKTICVDQSGHKTILWLGTRGGGINLFDIETETTFRHTCVANTLCCLGSNIINTIFRDRSGVVWFGTDCCGLNKFMGRDIFFEELESTYNIPGGWGYNPVWSFHEDEVGNLWLATSNGLKKVDRKYKKLIHYDHDKDNPGSLSSNAVTSIYASRAGDLWIGTEVGLNWFQPKTEQFIRFIRLPRLENSLSDNGIVSITEDRSGKIWIGTKIGGVNILDPSTGRFQQNNKGKGNPNSLVKTAVMAIIESDRKFGNSVWIGTYNDGLIEYDPDQDHSVAFQHDHDDPSTISHNSISSLLEDSLGYIWIGTNGGGLNRYDRENKEFLNFSIRDGLPDNTIFSLVLDYDGKLWLSTAKGLSRFDPVTKTFRNYSVGGSPQSAKEVYGTLYRSPDGEIYYSTFSGIFTFYPDDMPVRFFVPPVRITGFQLTHLTKIREIPLENRTEIEFDHNQNFFSIQYAVLDYTDPEKNQFMYKLDGVDRDWIYAGNENKVSYTDVKPGRFQFIVKGANSDGTWNQTGAMLNITVNPPPWNTWWAYSLYVFALVLVFYGINRFFVKRDRLKNLARLKELEARKLEEINEMKTQFFTNISHEIRTPLTLILGPLQRLLAKTRNKQTKMYLDIMYKNADMLHNLIDQLLDHSKLDTGTMRLRAQETDINSFLRKQILSFEPLAESLKKRLILRSSPEMIHAYIDHDKLQKIMANLISNAMKFGKAEGTVEVSITISLPRKARIGSKNYFFPDTNYLCLMVKDDGCGIPAEEIDKIFDRFYQVQPSDGKKYRGTGIGLALARELVELHHGFIDVESVEGSGSSFYVYLPLGSDHLLPDELSIQDTTEKVAADLAESRSKNRENGKKSGQQVSKNDKLVLLIVEDNPEMITYLTSILEEKYRIFSAADGAEALKTAVAEIPDLVISDIMMQGMDGLDFCHRLKTDERTSHIPIMLLTADTTIKTKLTGLQLGADDYIVKPFESSELEARVTNLIAQRKKLRLHWGKKMSDDLVHAMPTEMDEKFMRRVLEIIEINISDPEFSVEFLADELALSRVQLYRKLRALTDKSASELIRKLRLQMAARLMACGSGNIIEIAYEVGFNNLSYFAKCFREEFGLSPSEYINGVVPENN